MHGQNSLILENQFSFISSLVINFVSESCERKAALIRLECILDNSDFAEKSKGWKKPRTKTNNQMQKCPQPCLLGLTGSVSCLSLFPNALEDQKCFSPCWLCEILISCLIQKFLSYLSPTERKGIFVMI